MPLLVGSLAALVALAASILAKTQWDSALERGGIALVVGWLLGAVWQAVFTQIKAVRSEATEQASDE